MSDHTPDDQLQTLLRTDLHAHADHLGVPFVPAAAVLGRGRRLRRRRRALAGSGAVAAALVLGGVLLVSLPSGGGISAPDPASTPGDATVFAVGSQVYVGGASVEVPGTVHSLHYTSEGVLVRSNAHGGISDGSGPEMLTLVGGDGRSVDLGEVPEGYAPATAPDLRYYALAEERGDGFVAVVRDVTTGDATETIALPDRDPAPWDVPRLSLAGDVLFADFAEGTWAADWHTGIEVPTAVDPTAGGDLHAGLYAAAEGERRVVRGAYDGHTFLTVTLPEGAFGWLDLSPDGAYAMAFVEELADGSEISETTVYDVATGHSVVVQGAAWELGWTRDGHVYRVDGDVVTTCSATTGACTEEEVAIERASVPEPVEHTETICDKHGRSCGTSTWTESRDAAANKVTLAGRSHES